MIQRRSVCMHIMKMKGLGWLSVREREREGNKEIEIHRVGKKGRERKVDSWVET